MSRNDLVSIARTLFTRGKGILAADESTPTISKRFSVFGVESTAETRRDYREILFGAREAIQQSISGVILYDETIRQSAKDETPFVKMIEAAGAIPGVKVDAGAVALAGFEGETVTEGLDGLRERLKEYHALGARFAKWRAVFSIGENIPTAYAVDVNAHGLARYAALCQEAGLVPIVEPEVLMEGAHDLETCAEVTEFVLKTVFMRLYEAHVLLEGVALKPNMIVPGKKCPRQAAPEQVARATLRVLSNCAPIAVAGIAFLSGGQSDLDATANLDAINRLGGPWPLSFSYGRALQTAPLQAWAGKAENAAAAQSAFDRRARMNGLAAQGLWTSESEKTAA